MKIKLNINEFDAGLRKLSEKYKIYAPKSLDKRGTYSDTSVVRYEEVSSFEEMEWERKSDFSPKKTLLPINEVLFYFTEDEYKTASVDKKDILIFLRTCDMHSIKRLDAMYLHNGPKDYFYKRLRERAKFVVVGCTKSFRNCFCVSMDANIPDDYDMGMNIRGNTIFLDIVDEDLNVFNGINMPFQVDYITENKFKVNVPDKVDFLKIKDAELWNEYDSRCIACGRCNYSCPTCTCFTMQDIYYKQNENVGERRRVWASCQVDGFTSIAGGHSFREKHGQRMRFKALHKIKDFKSRFGYNMCVGCGRCDDQCPQYISFSTVINKVNDFMENLGDNNE